jgi:sugar/nucleoside kinase (ribokinase family)
MLNSSLSISRIYKNSPICVGMGLVALDVILNGSPETPPKIFAGGSCGNVLSILSFLGWTSYPIARLKKNRAADELIGDLLKWQVKTDLVFTKDDGSTPIIIHRILRDKTGKPTHRFEFKIPETKQWLPNFKAVVNGEVDLIKQIVPKTKVFYFDRLSRSSIELAKYYKQKGSLIFFEPSSMTDERLFNESVQTSHIIKFSKERLPNYSTKFHKNQCVLEIETLGSKGIRYRTTRSRNKTWQIIKAPHLDSVQDAAGAGDWCSAGIIHTLGIRGAKGFRTVKKYDIETALMKGQILGALNCKFDGARGLMYNTTFRDLSQNVKELSSDKQPIIKHSTNTINQITDFSFEKLIAPLS